MFNNMFELGILLSFGIFIFYIFNDPEDDGAFYHEKQIEKINEKKGVDKI